MKYFRLPKISFRVFKDNLENETMLRDYCSFWKTDLSNLKKQIDKYQKIQTYLLMDLFIKILLFQKV